MNYSIKILSNQHYLFFRNYAETKKSKYQTLGYCNQELSSRSHFRMRKYKCVLNRIIKDFSNISCYNFIKHSEVNLSQKFSYYDFFWYVKMCKSICRLRLQNVKVWVKISKIPRIHLQGKSVWITKKRRLVEELFWKLHKTFIVCLLNRESWWVAKYYFRAKIILLFEIRKKMQLRIEKWSYKNSDFFFYWCNFARKFTKPSFWTMIATNELLCIKASVSTSKGLQVVIH